MNVKDNQLLTSRVFVEWLVDGPIIDLPEETFAKFAVHFLSRCIEQRKIPIIFDKLFQLGNNLADERDFKAVEAFSKLHHQQLEKLVGGMSKFP